MPPQALPSRTAPSGGNGSTVVSEATGVAPTIISSVSTPKIRKDCRCDMFVETPFFEISMMVSLLVALAGPWLGTLTRGRSPAWLNILAYVAAVTCFMLWGPLFGASSAGCWLALITADPEVCSATIDYVGAPIAALALANLVLAPIVQTRRPRNRSPQPHI